MHAITVLREGCLVSFLGTVVNIKAMPMRENCLNRKHRAHFNATVDNDNEVNNDDNSL